MNEKIGELFDWNPMAEDFYDEKCNKYDDINEGTVDAKIKKDCKKNQMQYPYLIIRKDTQLITDTLLRNFFGNGLIYDIEYKFRSRQYFVYLNSLCSLEAARTKIRQFPNIINVQQARSIPIPCDPTDLEAEENKENEAAVSTATPPTDDSSPINIGSRTIQVSPTNNKHPEFFKIPIVVKSDYTAKNSLLALNDPSSRYLNVRFEFVLERHGAYVLQKAIENNQAMLHLRSGRRIVIPNKQLLETPSDGKIKLEELFKKCLACKCYTDNSCRFCQMPFCNPTCFEALLSQHNQSCKTGKPPLIDDTIVSQFNKIKLPATGTSVKITAFEQTDVIYVRSAEINADVAYHKVLADVWTNGKSLPQLQKLPQCGQIVIYKFETDIVRAMVLNVDNAKAIYVVCVDFGSVEITTLDKLYECSAYLAALPRYAVPVILRGVPKRCFPPNLLEMLYEVDQNNTFVMKYAKSDYDETKGMQRVILIESELNRSLNRLIKTILTPVEPSLSEASFKEDYLQHVHLPTGKKLDVVVMDNSFLKFGMVHCTTLDFAYEISQIHREIQHYGEASTTDSYAPPKNELCIAQYQGKWCRGLCMELVGDGYPSILFIDYGNIVPIYVEKIRPYPPQFTFPIMTTEYDLNGQPEPSVELLARMEKLLVPGSIINCDEIIYNKDENNYSLRIDSLME
ncbi:protein vreteno [Drosophila albomicans]|uniref:Protein vreteno n=1 Tax=Drosophila albomicans TaxID=7291 RepID=A0A9C6SVF7_DROAB|nr:protein vreteno [Drosophila albomicans]XP_051862569.1 protein vreteno [Drosophila albomicans]